MDPNMESGEDWRASPEYLALRQFMGTEEDLQARPKSGTRAEYGPTIIRLSVGSERKKARKKAVAGLASLLIVGGCSGLVFGSGIMNGPRPDSREEEAAALVEATMTAYGSCSDGIHNGEETDVDCGRACAPNLCAIGRMCQSDDDCGSGLCNERQFNGQELHVCESGEPMLLPTSSPREDDGGWAGSSYCSYNPCSTDEVRQLYFPIEGCAPSRVRVGDYVYVSYGGTPNGIRSEPRLPADNVIGKAYQGEAMTIVGGPECSGGLILWEVITDSGLSGWTPEGNGEEFWLIPIDGPRELPPEVSNNPRAQEAYQEASRIMGNSSLSDSQKQERIRVMQDSFGEELVTTVLRYVPVYNSEADRFESFDSYMRGFASDYGQSTSDAPIERDPVGASLRIFFDPSQDTISDMLGLDDWLP